MRLRGGLYHFTQIKFAYNTNRIEGSRLTEDQTRYIYEANTISTGDNQTANVDDIIGTIQIVSKEAVLQKIKQDTYMKQIQ